MSNKNLESLLNEGCAVICFLSHYALYPSKTPRYPYGHMVILTGFDQSSIYFHENNPKHSEPNKKLPKEEFCRVWVNPDGTFGDTIATWPKKPQE